MYIYKGRKKDTYIHSAAFAKSIYVSTYSFRKGRVAKLEFFTVRLLL